MEQFKNIQQLQLYKESPQGGNGDKVLIVSNATCGRANGSAALVEALRESWEKNNLYGEAHLRVTGCLGFCDKEPLVIVRPEGFIYPQPRIRDIEEIINESLLGGKMVERLAMKDPATGEIIRTEQDSPFYKHQLRWLFGDNFELDPTSLEDYL
ncbi:MAG: (2Fe-2S) ferredoxin domain-containing protein, partial [Gemmatimonadota bacterium]|nr:(2Fe-2S) ferredoxin domain-containing protein [Gemmatimonadota bacterium]